MNPLQLVYFTSFRVTWTLSDGMPEFSKSKQTKTWTVFLWNRLQNVIIVYLIDLQWCLMLWRLKFRTGYVLHTFVCAIIKLINVGPLLAVVLPIVSHGLPLIHSWCQRCTALKLGRKRRDFPARCWKSHLISFIKNPPHVRCGLLPKFFDHLLSK